MTSIDEAITLSQEHGFCQVSRDDPLDMVGQGGQRNIGANLGKPTCKRWLKRGQWYLLHSRVGLRMLLKAGHIPNEHLITDPLRIDVAIARPITEDCKETWEALSIHRPATVSLRSAQPWRTTTGRSGTMQAGCPQ